LSLKTTYRFVRLVLFAAVVTLAVGCRNRDQKNGTKTTTSVSGESFLLVVGNKTPPSFRGLFYQFAAETIVVSSKTSCPS